MAFAYTVDGDDQLTVIAPARRWILALQLIFYEEIARIYGYDNLPSTLPTMTRNRGGLTPRQRFIRASRHDLEGMGLTQAISYSLTTIEKAKQFQIKPLAGNQ